MAATSTPHAGLAHLSYYCPGLHGEDSRNNLQVCGFRPLLNGSQCKRLVVPLFQRRYCWERKQTAGWYRDVTEAGGAVNVDLQDITACEGGGYSSNQHSCGRVILVRETDDSESQMVVDGQQRVTTTMLLIASLRDAALNILKDLDQADPNTTIVKQLVNRLHKLMFSETAAASKFARARATSESPCLSQAAAETIEWSRVVPSFADRIPFYELLLEGMVLHYQEQGSPVAVLSEETLSSFQYNTKRTFDEEVAITLSKTASTEEAIQKVAELQCRALDYMKVVWMEILNKIQLGQVFLWLQEKELFSVGGILFNPHPGIKFYASDLVRNLVLYPIVDSCSTSIQRKLHQELWLEPIEMRYAGPSEIDDAFESYLNWRAGPDEDPERHRSENEVSIRKVCDAPTVSKDTSKRLRLYARFVSYFEAAVLSKVREDTDIKDKDMEASGDESAEPLVIESPLVSAVIDMVRDLGKFCAADKLRPQSQ